MEHKQKTGLSKQIYTLVVISIAIMGIVTAVSQYLISRERTRAHTDIVADAAAGEIISSIKEYPAYRWLLSYWAEHADEMEVEYDVDPAKESVAEEKIQVLQERHPEFDLRFSSDEEAAALPPEDQLLYAEIIYSRLASRMNGIKQNFKCDYLFCAVTDTDAGEHPYEYLLYLFSGADPGSVRGTEYGEVYKLGVTVPAEDDAKQQENLRQAVLQYMREKRAGRKHDDSGRYIDYYTCLGLLGDRAVLAGTSFSRQAMNKTILFSALIYTLNTVFLELLLLNLAMLFIHRYILHPMRRVLNIIRSYAETKDSGTTEKDLTGLLAEKTGIAVRQNEVGQLAEDFVDLTHERARVKTKVVLTLLELVQFFDYGDWNHNVIVLELFHGIEVVEDDVCV